MITAVGGLAPPHLTPITVNPKGSLFSLHIERGADGTVAVTYYDFRESTPDENTLSIG
jgi:hypothetical protein